MKSNQRGTAWPYLFVLLGLFVLSVAAPRAWNRQRYAGPPLERLLDEQKRSALPDTTERAATIKPLPKTVADADSTWKLSSDAVAPVIVAPLKAFGRQVVDPIVEFARKPTSLPTLRDFRIPDFATRDKPEQSTAWALPQSLLDDLDRLTERPAAAEWATHVSACLKELYGSGDARRDPDEILAELRVATNRSSLPVVEDEELGAEIQRARYGLGRRLELWDRITQFDAFNGNDQLTVELNLDEAGAHQLADRVAKVEQLATTVSVGNQWLEYLKIDQLRAAADKSQAERRDLAREILGRLGDQRLSAAQRGFISRPELISLKNELRGMVAEPVEMPRLLARVEQFESTQLASDAKLVAEDIRSLRWIGDEPSRELGERIDLHYRNANVRVSISTAFLNRFVPQPTATRSRVRETIQGVPVEGSSTTFTSLAIRAIPDPHRIRLGMEASGMVASNTSSDAGPATFYNRAQSSFIVRKLVLFGPSGLRVWPAVSEADSNFTNLTDVETSFDGVPLIGPLVRNYAVAQHEDAQPEARREMENRVASRARQQFDAEATHKLDELTERVDTELLEPLRRLGLQPAALDMRTSTDRITARVRLAGELQLGAHTPRPRAPSDSLASLQVHQSAMNNLFESLDLAGREFNVPELYKWIGTKMSRPISPPEDVPENVVIRFAEANPIRVAFAEGEMQLTIRVARLSHGRKRWHDFDVKTVYQPDTTSLDGRLVRTGGIFLEGESVQGRPEFVLRSIFSKALSVDRPWRMVPEKVASDPRMKGFMLGQFVIEDGWIGIAYAPRRIPSEIARRPK
jgi:hypothetical protein